MLPLIESFMIHTTIHHFDAMMMCKTMKIEETMNVKSLEQYANISHAEFERKQSEFSESDMRERGKGCAMHNGTIVKVIRQRHKKATLLHTFSLLLISVICLKYKIEIDM